MSAITFLALTLTLALVQADGKFIVPGVREQQMRPKRQESRILFPELSFDVSRFLPGNDGFPPLPQPSSLSVTPEEDTDATLDLPDDLDLNGMDRNSLALVNNIDNITAFADLFGITLPANDEPRFAMDGGLLSRSSIVTIPSQLATMATCKPELRTVELDLPVEPNTLFYPTCVRLEQCGGCCYGPLLTCRPKTTKVVKLKVLKTVITRSSSSSSSSSISSRRTVERAANGRRRQGRRGRRRRRQSIPSYHEVDAIKHVQCECGCKVQEQDCNPAIHNYIEGECACVCKRRDEKRKCEQQKDTKYWDSDSCACYCRRNVDCSTGEIFSQDSCKCERLMTRGGFPIEPEAAHIERRRRPFERPRRRRPHRIPLRPDAELSSSRNAMLSHGMNSAVILTPSLIH